MSNFISIDNTLLYKIQDGNLWVPFCAGLGGFIFFSYISRQRKAQKSVNNNKKQKSVDTCTPTSEIFVELEKIIEIVEVEDQVENSGKEIDTILTCPMPPCGFKEVFLTIPAKGKILSNSPASQCYTFGDLIRELRERSNQLRTSSKMLEQFVAEKNKLRDEINLLQSQLEAEEELRISAEAKSSLMHKELERLHRVQSEHNIESEDLLQRIKQLKIEIELIDASRSDSGESSKKIQMMVAEMQADHTQTKEEVLNLRETNKTLIQKIAHQRQRREQFLREISELKAYLAELTPKRVTMEDIDYMYRNPYDKLKFVVGYGQEEENYFGDYYSSEDEERMY